MEETIWTRADDRLSAYKMICQKNGPRKRVKRLIEEISKDGHRAVNFDVLKEKHLDSKVQFSSNVEDF